MPYTNEQRFATKIKLCIFTFSREIINEP